MTLSIGMIYYIAIATKKKKNFSNALHLKVVKENLYSMTNF